MIWTWKQELQVRVLWRRGMTFNAIAERMGLSRQQVANKAVRLVLPHDQRILPDDLLTRVVTADGDVLREE